jgi:phosphopantetheinyl transferase
MTIFWSLTPTQSELALHNQEELINDLGNEEASYFRSIRFPKRSIDWLAGRLAMKQLLAKVVPDFSELHSRELQIIKAENGAPLSMVKGKRWPDGQISISHSHGMILCAWSADCKLLGIDLERIEERTPVFALDYFTSGEVTQIAQIAAGDGPFWTTLTWSAKEAVLKALQIGLRVDTRSIDFDLASSEPCVLDWNALRFSTSLVAANSLRLFWRREGKFVVTICSQEDQATRLVQV